MGRICSKGLNEEIYLDNPDCLTPDHPQQGDLSRLRGEVVHCIVEFAPGAAQQKSRICSQHVHTMVDGDEFYLARLRPDPLLLETLDLYASFLQRNNL